MRAKRARQLRKVAAKKFTTWDRIDRAYKGLKRLWKDHKIKR